MAIKTVTRTIQMTGDEHLVDRQLEFVRLLKVGDHIQLHNFRVELIDIKAEVHNDDQMRLPNL